MVGNLNHLNTSAATIFWKSWFFKIFQNLIFSYLSNPLAGFSLLFMNDNDAFFFKYCPWSYPFLSYSCKKLTPLTPFFSLLNPMKKACPSSNCSSLNLYSFSLFLTQIPKPSLLSSQNPLIPPLTMSSKCKGRALSKAFSILAKQTYGATICQLPKSGEINTVLNSKVELSSNFGNPFFKLESVKDLGLPHLLLVGIKGFNHVV